MPMNGPVSVQPTVTWTEVAVADVLSALRSLTVTEGTWSLKTSPGERVETYLGWARDALESAEAAEEQADADTRSRNSVEAVLHAKRALDRLFDLYLQRDSLHLHLRDRASFTEKLDLLKRRMGSRKIPWRLIPTVIADPRNDAEHEFSTPPLHEVALAVEAAEAVASAMRSGSDPRPSPALLGLLLCGTSFSETTGAKYWFHGFGPPNSGFALCWCGNDGIARVSAIRVVANDTASVLWAPLLRFSAREHLELLTWWDTHPPHSSWSEKQLRAQLSLAGLDSPPPA